MRRWSLIVLTIALYAAVMLAVATVAQPISDGIVDFLDNTFGKLASSIILLACIAALGWSAYRDESP